MAGRELILRRADGTVVCGRCKLADHPLARLRGLLGREGLDSGEGIHVRPLTRLDCWASRSMPIDLSSFSPISRQRVSRSGTRAGSRLIPIAQRVSG